MKLWAQFGELGVPAGSPEFIADRIAGWPNFRLSKDQLGRPALLIALQGVASDRLQPNLDLKHVSFLPATSCEVSTPNGTELGVFAIVRSKTDDKSLQELFVEVLGTWIETLPQEPSVSAIRSGFDRLAHLFETLSELRSADVVGLWGELFVIACGTSPESLVRAWHVDVRELHDFQAGTQLVEVKTTTGRIRRHEFSLQQLSPPTGTNLVVASVMLDTTGDTISVAQLARVVKAQLQMPELRLRVDEVVAATLGAAWGELAASRFNAQAALSSLRFFDGASVPCVERDLPVEVSEVRFRAELDGVNPLLEQALVARSALHAALKPVSRGRVEERCRS